MRALDVPPAVVFTMLAAAPPALGHHSFAGQFDANKPVNPGRYHNPSGVAKPTHLDLRERAPARWAGRGLGV